MAVAEKNGAAAGGRPLGSIADEAAGRIADDDLAELREALGAQAAAMDAVEAAVARHPDTREARDAFARASGAVAHATARMARRYGLAGADRVEADGRIVRGG